ncbi:DUF4030 domain-containing protein [Priestia megaterium]|uniref:DUF4030 domain-containing protein n=1 Tax=Priestia megaterium TaxID=1404 RepID=UPI00366AE065
MSDHLSDDIKREIDQIKVPEKELNQVIQSAIQNSKEKKPIFNKRLLYFGSVAVLLFGLFISSAFISPAMAKVASKIPYFGQIFEPKSDIVSDIGKELRKRGYRISGVGVSYPQKEIQVEIDGSKSYINNVREEIEKIIEEILKSKSYNAYTFKVGKYNDYKGRGDAEEEKDKARKEFEEEYTKVHRVIHQELTKRGYNLLSYGMSYRPKTLEVEIPKTETRIKELKQVINDTLATNGVKPIPITIKKTDMIKREQEDRWSDILDVVSQDLLGKKEYKVRTVGFSVYPEPEIQAFITLSSSEEHNKEFAEQLEKVIDNFLQSDQMKTRVKGESYHIKIFSKDNKVIN